MRTVSLNRLIRISTDTEQNVFITLVRSIFYTINYCSVCSFNGDETSLFTVIGPIPFSI